MSSTDGPVKKISPKWTGTDRLGHIMARLTSFRMRYSVAPGLYAAGTPDENSDIFVSANYKLSFDILRRELEGMNAWVLVLDTQGINVWCAAGKGTFGTDELSTRIMEAGIERLVKHRRIIVPQLGAPGVNSGEVKKRTGFRISFGPVYAADISQYINNNYRATEEMRTIRFTLMDRLVLTPLEINPAMKIYFLLALAILAVFGLQPHGIIFRDAFIQGLPFVIAGFLAVIGGALITPMLLPFIPFRSFALKGWITGMVIFFLLSKFFKMFAFKETVLTVLLLLFFPLLTSYVALQFTGATTYTGISGVKKELKIGLPIYISVSIISLALIVVHKLAQWGIL